MPKYGHAKSRKKGLVKTPIYTTWKDVFISKSTFHMTFWDILHFYVPFYLLYREGWICRDFTAQISHFLFIV